MNVYYLGPINSYSYVIASQLYPSAIYKLIPMSSFEEIFAKVSAESDSIGILPIENSSTSNVHENIDMLFKSNLQIIAEANLMIKLNLLGLGKLSDIKSVMSHPKALAQCSKFIEQHNLSAIETPSTSEAAAEVKKQNNTTIAAIGGSTLADSELKILAPNIGNNKHNMTRFVVISQSATDNYTQQSSVKITLKFKAKHEAGSLAKVLTALANAGANLTKIESRPIPDTDWEYDFWIDLITENAKLDVVKNAILNTTLEFKLVGTYLPGKIFES